MQFENNFVFETSADLQYIYSIITIYNLFYYSFYFKLKLLFIFT